MYHRIIISAISVYSLQYIAKSLKSCVSLSDRACKDTWELKARHCRSVGKECKCRAINLKFLQSIFDLYQKKMHYKFSFILKGIITVQMAKIACILDDQILKMA